MSNDAAAKPPVTCHVLDTTIGRPAQNVKCTLLHFPPTPAADSPVATVVATAHTNADGRVTAWSSGSGEGEPLLLPALVAEGGVFKIRFEVEEYFARTGQETFFPFVDVAFRVRGTGIGIGGSSEHYHIPLLLAPWGFSTYRGS